MSVGPLWRRLLLVAPMALAIFGMWTAVRWCIGNTVAGYAPEFEVARSAERLAPDDPQTHFTLAVLKKNSFAVNALGDSLPHYERAVSLSPNDYRLWLELGRAREQAGDAPGGEKALRKAIELAPAYAYPHWLLGNLLLRERRTDEAFAELRRAAESDPGLRPQVFGLAWRAFNEDVTAVTEAVAASSGARAQLAQFLVQNKRLDGAVTLWSDLSQNDKREQQETGQTLIRALLGEKRFLDVLGVYRSISSDVKIGAVNNGGFEYDIGPAGVDLFGWQVTSDPRAQIRLDAANQFHGKRSLRIIFNAATSLDFQNVSQLIAVEPNSRYRVDCFVRTEDLKSASTLVTEVIDAADPRRVLASSDPAPNGSNTWQQVTFEFNTSPQTEAINLRLSRASCITGVCPIFGKVWYDDFNLERVGGASANARSNNDGSANDGAAANAGSAR
ncbi:MAG: carbohydrate binding domain-containing protein [Pyrinomonadaceae bacterium]